MMKRLILSVVSIGFTVGIFAQSVQDGVKALYYEQLKKGKDILTKLVTANPADAEANYWLGQAYLEDDDIAKAKEVYTKALTATNQNPLIIVGLAHIETLEGKKVEARAHFDAAIEPTKSKKNKKYGDFQLLAAIGRANADGGTEIGDPVYGIEKLKQAAEIEEKDPEIKISEGLSFLKRGGEFGGNAKSAFDDALIRDPKYARAYYRIGKIFESQKNSELFLDNYNKAIGADPAYAPAYLALYNYYSTRDVNKAKEYLDKYVANVEKDKEIDFFKADYSFRAGQYDVALTEAKAIEAGLAGESYPKIHKLLALIYDRKGDSVTAVTEMEKYVTTENPAKITPDSYLDVATLFAKVPGKEDKADEYFTKAVEADTVLANKISIITQVGAAYAKAKNGKGQLKWLDQLAVLKPDLTATEYFYWGAAAEADSNYPKAIDIYKKYIAKYPDQVQGYAGQLRSAIKSDPDTSLGAAIPAVDEYNAFLAKDTVKNKNRIITNVGYKVYYYANKAKDYPKAVASLDEILALDPANQYALSAKEQLLKILNKKAGSGGASTGTSGGSKTGKPAAN